MTADQPRAEHLAWCKQRALSYVDRGDVHNAFASMVSDLTKHPDTADHVGIQLGLMEQLAGTMTTTEHYRRWIEGFN